MSVTVEKAIKKGVLVVNGPILLIFTIGFFLPVILKNRDLAVYSIGASFILGWIWWSFSVVKWRAWAYENVEIKNIMALKKAAVASFLTWPDGSVFSKTEIKSNKEIEKEKQIEEKAGVANVAPNSFFENYKTHIQIFIAVAVMVFLSNFFK